MLFALRPARRAAALLALAAPAAGCSSKEQAAYPVEFRVLAAGKPAAGATVVLHPVAGATAGGHRPVGRVADDGTVRVSTFGRDDGAPPGDYTLTVRWFEEAVRGEEGKVLGPDRLKGKHSNPAKSTLRLSVKKETNRLPAVEL